MIYDRIIGNPGLVERINVLSNEGEIEILSTHIQDGQLSRIPDSQKRTKISKINRRGVVTDGFILDLSLLDEAAFCDGEGVSLRDIQSDSNRHTEDALIATTASRDADVLVTEDRRLFNRFEASTTDCEVWLFDKFLRFIQKYPI
jgi:hypothetical protein